MEYMLKNIFYSRYFAYPGGRRGLMTLFMALGVLIVLIFGLLLWYRAELVGFREVPAKLAPLASYVQDCFDLLARFGIYKLGIQGGFIDLPSDFYTDGLLEVAYAWNVTNLFSKKDELKSRLEDFIEAEMPACVLNFAPFIEQGWSIEAGQPSVEAILAARDVQLVLNWTLKLRKEDFSGRLERWSVSVPVALALVHKEIDGFVGLFPQHYDLTYLGLIESNSHIIALDEQEDLLVSEHLKSQMLGEPYIFAYAVHFPV